MADNTVWTATCGAMDCYLRGNTKMQPKIVTVLVCARTKQEDRKSSTTSKQTVSKSGVQAPYGHFPSMYIIDFGAGDFLGERLCFCSLQLRHIQNISRGGGLGTVRYKSNKP